MQNLHYYFQMIEDAIAKIGLDPRVARQKDAGKWTITKGRIPVWIDVFYYASEKRNYFQVVAPVMKMPKVNSHACALELLKINAQLFGVAFCLKGENIYIKAIRETDGLDVNEALSTIMRVGNYADHYDDVLKAKFPGWESVTSVDLPQNPN